MTNDTNRINRHGRVLRSGLSATGEDCVNAHTVGDEGQGRAVRRDAKHGDRRVSLPSHHVVVDLVPPAQRVATNVDDVVHQRPWLDVRLDLQFFLDEDLDCRRKSSRELEDACVAMHPAKGVQDFDALAAHVVD